METHLVYLLGTLLAVDVIVLTAWAVPCMAGTKIGYRWRKILWMILAVRLLVRYGYFWEKFMGSSHRIFTGSSAHV